MIKGCLVELFDERFELGEIRYLDGIRSVAHDNYRNKKNLWRIIFFQLNCINIMK
jgi:hypothetical protein